MKKSFSAALNYSEAYFRAIIYPEHQYVSSPYKLMCKVINENPKVRYRVPPYEPLVREAS